MKVGQAGPACRQAGKRDKKHILWLWQGATENSTVCNNLLDDIERINPSAAASLRKGLEETLTVHHLGVTGLLRKTLSTTNPIESCFSVTRTITGRVKRWSGGDMVQRWAVAALLRAEKKSKRVKATEREIPKLVAALGQKSLDRKEMVA